MLVDVMSDINCLGLEFIQYVNVVSPDLKGLQFLMVPGWHIAWREGSGLMIVLA